MNASLFLAIVILAGVISGAIAGAVHVFIQRTLGPIGLRLVIRRRPVAPVAEEARRRQLNAVVVAGRR